MIGSSTRRVEHTYRAGDRVILYYNSANRDETAFTDPYAFELLTRVPGIHATAEPVRQRTSFVNGITALPCAF